MKANEKRKTYEKIAVVLLMSLLAAATVFSNKAYAGGGNKNRNLLIVTSALGGTLTGTVLGILADRTFLRNPSSTDQSQQYVSPAAARPMPPAYASDALAAGYNEGYLEGLRQARRQRYYDANRQWYED